MAFPVTRMRRLRQSDPMRSLVRETRLTPAGLVYPLFVCPGRGVRKEIGSLPGVANLSVDQAVKEAREGHGLGLPALLLFGLPAEKDEGAPGAWADDGIVQQAARAIKQELPELLIIGDVCLCEYMSHGHCGIVRQAGAAVVAVNGDRLLLDPDVTVDVRASTEAARRLVEYGPNRGEEIEHASVALRFARQFTHFFALVLWFAAGLALLAELRNPGQGMGTLAYAIIGVIAVNGAFSFWQEHSARKSLAALKALLPPKVAALRDGDVARIDAAQLVPGDVILVQAGDHVPADCRLIEAWSLRVNLATITGESLPMPRNAEAAGEDDPLRARNVLLAGTDVVAGEGRAAVYATAMRTELGKIAGITQAAGEPPSPLQLEIGRLSRLVAALAALLGLAFFVAGRALGLGLWESLMFAVGIIVANVPEGLLPTVTLALALATKRMAARNALIRRLPAAEALGSATVIVTDKTGTLTANRMAATRAVFAGKSLDVASIDAAAATRHARFFEIAACCHSVYQAGASRQATLLGDPTEIALIEMAQRARGARSPLPRVDQISFDADRVRDERVKVLQAIKPMQPEVILHNTVRGQYGEGTMDGHRVPAYRSEPRVKPNSATETYAALGLHIDNWRWAGVPWYLRSGKYRAATASEVFVQLKPPPQRLFADSAPRSGRTNYLRFRLSPSSAVALAARVKRPGKEFVGDPRERLAGQSLLL